MLPQNCHDRVHFALGHFSVEWMGLESSRPGRPRGALAETSAESVQR